MVNKLKRNPHKKANREPGYETYKILVLGKKCICIREKEIVFRFGRAVLNAQEENYVSFFFLRILYNWVAVIKEILSGYFVLLFLA